MAVLALGAGAIAASCYQPPTDANSRRFGLVAVAVAIVFLFFSLSFASDTSRSLHATAALDRGRVAQLEGTIADVTFGRSSRTSNGPHRGFALAFQVHDQWFLVPFAARCGITIGAHARVSFIPNDGSRLTPLVVRLEMDRPCAKRPPDSSSDPYNQH